MKMKNIKGVSTTLVGHNYSHPKKTMALALIYLLILPLKMRTPVTRDCSD